MQSNRSPRWLLFFVDCFFIATALGLIGTGVYASLTQPSPHPPHTHPSHQSSPKKPHPKPSKTTKPAPDYLIPPITAGLAPVLSTIPTNQPVIFLGIDDGNFKDQSELQMMKDHNIRASLYLSRLFIDSDPDFFKAFIPAGSLIENHTLSHDVNMIATMSYDEMKQEICGMADYIQQHYGRRPIFFRPPGGSYNITMQKAAADCGMRAIVTWIAKANGGSMQYQVGNTLRPGDIVLMHFRPEFKQDMRAFIDATAKAGLHTELLEDWVAPAN